MVHGDELTNDGSVLCLVIHQASSVFFVYHTFFVWPFHLDNLLGWFYSFSHDENCHSKLSLNQSAPLSSHFGFAFAAPDRASEHDEAHQKSRKIWHFETGSFRHAADTAPLEGLSILRCAIYDPVEGLQISKMRFSEMGV